MVEAINELSLASTSGFRSKHDDFLDTISMLAVMRAWRPSEAAPMAATKSDGGMWELDVEDEPDSRLASYVV